MLGVYETTILWLESVQSLHLQGCVEHPQGQAYKSVAALRYLSVRSFFRFSQQLQRWQGMLGYIQSALGSSCLGHQTRSSQCQAVVADKTSSSFLRLLCHHGSRGLLAGPAWAQSSQGLLLFQSQPVGRRAGEGSTTRIFLVYSRSSGCHRQKFFGFGRFLGWKIHLCYRFLFSQVFTFNPL